MHQAAPDPVTLGGGEGYGGGEWRGNYLFPSPLPVRNIPKFKDRANWSRDTFQPMRRRACVYRNKSINSLRKHPFLLALRRWDVSRGGTSATQRQKSHTDDANQFLLNKSGSHGVPNANLVNFRFLLVDFGKELCFICERVPAKLKCWF